MDKYISVFRNTFKENELISGNFTNYKVTYNEEQERFIKSPLENSKLLGIPGGGKTQSIIGKIIHHYSKNEITNINQFLILTFSRRACNDFIEKGKRQNKLLFNTKNIRTLHSLAGKIVFKIHEKNSSSQDTIIISAIDLINKAMNPNYENYEAIREELLEMPEFTHLKAIFVDEAQDISFIQYDLVLKIASFTNASVIMIGDPNQNIYQFQNGSDQYLLNHTGPTYSLIKNYRSTPHIVNFVNSFRPWTNMTEVMVSTKEESDQFNRKPVIFNGTVEEVIKDIVEKIMRSPFPREEIAIIGPVKKSMPKQDSYSNIGLSLFTNLLNQYGIQYIKHYEDAKSEEENLREIHRQKEHVNLMTIHGSKGLEFQQVFLVNFHTSTYGIIPSEEKYKEFKYLWYVGLSRAIYDLHVYIDKSKIAWNELKTCPKDLYINENFKPSFLKELKFQEEIKPIYHTVTEILNSKKMMSDESLFNLEHIFKYEVETIPIFNVNIDQDTIEEFTPKSIKNYKDYNALYGMYIENIFNYYYSIKLAKTPDFITKLRKMIENTIVIPKHLTSGYKMLKIRLPYITKNIVRLNDLAKIKNQFKKSEEDLFVYLCELLNNNYHREFFIDCHNDVANYSKVELLKAIDNILLHKVDITQNIFKITIFYYQMNYETAYLWNTDMTEELNDLQYYVDKIRDFVEKRVDRVDGVDEEFTFHQIVKHPKLPLIGEMDMNNDKKIVDIKFSNNLSMKHVIQLLLYYHLLSPNFEKEYQLELWNFQLGNIYKIKINKESIDLYKLLKLLSKALGRKLENMIFLYDLETTGTAYANKKMDIIERHFEELTLGFVPSAGLLKPVGVPFIPFEVTQRTGITKEAVYESGDEYMTFQFEMNELLSCCSMPVFIAHNGNSFDHKIMIDKKILSYENARLLDSRVIIRLFLNDPVVNKSLSDIFQYLFKFTPVVHRAHSEVKMLISILKRLDITEEKILNILN